MLGVATRIVKFIVLLLWLVCPFVLTAHAAESPLSISIAVPIHHDQRTIYFDHTSKAHFPVVITNISTEPVKFWREWCSWGYFALSFEITDEHGKTWAASKYNSKTGKPIYWNRNFPDFWTIQPKESLVIDVLFADTEIWGGFPLNPEGHPHFFTMRVICAVRSEEHSKKLGVWTGQIMSEPQKYAFQVH